MENRSGTSISLTSKFLNESQLGVGDGRALRIIIYGKPRQYSTRVKRTNAEKKELGGFEFAGRTPCREVTSSCTRSRRLFSYLSGSAEFISLAKLETVEDERTVAN